MINNKSGDENKGRPFIRGASKGTHQPTNAQRKERKKERKKKSAKKTPGIKSS
jgi:hypothetical protein